MKNPQTKLGDVRLVRDCLLCKSEIILLASRDSSDSMPDNGDVVRPVCPECSNKYLNDGVLIVNDKSGACVVLKNEAFDNMFDAKVLDRNKHRVFMMEDDVFSRLFGEYIAGDQTKITNN